MTAKDDPEASGWLAGRCPVRVVADIVRGDPAKLQSLLFLASVWLEHEADCAASER